MGAVLMKKFPLFSVLFSGEVGDFVCAWEIVAD